MSQGDPAGIGPEILLEVAAGCDRARWTPLLVGERAAFEALDSARIERLRYFDRAPEAAEVSNLGEQIAVFDPVGEARQVIPGQSRAADAAGALAALDAALEFNQAGLAQAMVTAPVSKASIARHVQPDFRGHTEYLAHACGLGNYGRDYLMAFLTPTLQVALLTVYQPLREALDAIDSARIFAALRCLGRHAGGRIAVAGLNPHAGEGGLLGSEDDEVVRPAVEAAVSEGLAASGPESADSLFARAACGEFDWVLALYHDQGLIAVKTAGFGQSVNWTLGLPVLRTSVDHGTAFEIAGKGIANAAPMEQAVEATLGLLAGRLPRHTSSPASC